MSDFSLQRYHRHVPRAALLAALVGIAGWRAEVNVHDLVAGLGKGLSMVALFFPPAWDALPEMIARHRIRRNSCSGRRRRNVRVLLSEPTKTTTPTNSVFVARMILFA